MWLLRYTQNLWRTQTENNDGLGSTIYELKALDGSTGHAKSQINW